MLGFAFRSMKEKWSPSSYWGEFERVNPFLGGEFEETFKNTLETPNYPNESKINGLWLGLWAACFLAAS